MPEPQMLRNGQNGRHRDVRARGIDIIHAVFLCIRLDGVDIDDIDLRKMIRVLLGDVTGEIAARINLHPSFLTGEDQIRLRHSGAENQYFFHLSTRSYRVIDTTASKPNNRFLAIYSYSSII